MNNAPRPPRFLSDLFSDLRDRRLLIPVVALVVALVAVPVLLSSSGDVESAPAPVTAAVPADATAVQSAVFADESGIRNYRKRLDELKRKNPFEQKFTKAPKSERAGDGGSADATDESTGATEESAGAATAGSASAGSLAPAPEPVAAPDVEPVSNESTPADSGADDRRYYRSRVDITTGQLGDAKQIRDVDRLAILPSKQAPLASFVSVTQDLKRAVFLLAPYVTETDGKGTCEPKDRCQRLELAAGQQRLLRTANGGPTYRLRVDDIDLVRIPAPRDD